MQGNQSLNHILGMEISSYDLETTYRPLALIHIVPSIISTQLELNKFFKMCAHPWTYFIFVIIHCYVKAVESTTDSVVQSQRQSAFFTLFPEPTNLLELKIMRVGVALCTVVTFHSFASNYIPILLLYYFSTSYLRILENVTPLVRRIRGIEDILKCFHIVVWSYALYLYYMVYPLVDFLFISVLDAFQFFAYLERVQLHGIWNFNYKPYDQLQL